MSLWVFGYGSLLWNPGFEVAERQVASLLGYHRSFCMRSVNYRGTPQAPGLVLALDSKAEARCLGLGLRVREGDEAQVLEYLRARELVTSAYYEARLPITLADGQQVEAVSYVIDRDHAQYCGGMDLENQAQIIARAQGKTGPNTEYLFNTYAQLLELGLEDPEMEWLTARVRALAL